eukprot:gene2010-biopygen13054
MDTHYNAEPLDSATTNVASAPEEGSPSPEHAASVPQECSSQEEEAGATEEDHSSPDESPYIPGILAKSGSLGSPTISFSNAPDTGLFNPVARTLGVVAGGTEMVRVSDTTVSLLGDLVVSSNIVPITNATQYLGSSTMHFKEAWIDELHISSNTLYIGDTPVICADNDAVSIRADPGQGITLSTTGDGETSLVSAKGVNVVSEGGVTMRVSGPLGRVNIQSSGAGGTVNLGAEKEIVMTAPLTTISSNMIVKGDLTVEGSQLTDVVELVKDLVVVIEYVFAVHANSKRVAHVHHEVLKAVPQKIEDELQRTPSVELAEYVCHCDYPVDRVRIERDLDVLQDSREQTSYNYPDCFADTRILVELQA